MGIDPDTCDALLIDFAIAKVSSEAEASDASSTAGSIAAKKRRWDPEIVKEIEEQKKHGNT